MSDQSSTTRPSNEEILSVAQAMTERGWVPTPLHVVGPDLKTCTCPKGARCGKSAGKHNIHNQWQGVTDPADAIAAFEELHAKKRRTNVGILTGKPSGIFVLDVDIDREGGDDMRRLVSKHGKMPPTYIVKTGSGGFHYYFKMPADFDITNRDKPLRAAGYKGLDIRGTGGQVVAPPSLSWAGPYVVQADRPVADAPDWLLEILRPKSPATTSPEVDDDFWDDAPAKAAVEQKDAAVKELVQTAQQAAYERSIVNGELARVIGLKEAGWDQPWDTTTFEAACQLVELANAEWTTLSIDEAHQMFLDSCPPEEPGYEPQAKWDSALQRVGDKKRPAPKPRKDVLFEDDDADPQSAAGANRKDATTAPTSPAFSLSDLGNADRLIHWHGDAVRYAADAQTWLTYNEGVWADEEAEIEVEALSKDALRRAARREADSHSDEPNGYTKAGDPKPSDREEFFGWMGKSEMYAKIASMRMMARSDSRIRTSLGQFDRDPMLLNAANGVVDLATGEMLPHSPEQMFRHQSSIVYEPDAQCPMWEKFLLRVQPDEEMRDYLQMVLGYSITGRMDEHALFIHNGPGATGKTTFLEVVGDVLGNYGQQLERDTLMSKGGQTNTGATPDVARMAGARFLTASETAAGKKLDEERIKGLVGGDTQTARHLYGKPFEFKPTGKIHMATNHLPSFESGGDGMGRRLRLVPWEQQIPEGERDKTLKDRIVATEAAGVLAWLVRGAIAWSKAGGLTTPAEVDKRSKEHTEEADPVWPFINERLEPGEDYATEFQSIYGAYQSWSEANGNKPMSGRALSMALRERLGPDSKFLAVGTRRSMFKVKVNMVAVPEHHDAFFSGARA